MTTLQRIAVLAALAFTMSGCATYGNHGTDWFDHWSKCALAGGVAGGAVGAIADDSDAAATGLLGGAIIGGVWCAIRDHQAVADYKPAYGNDGDADNDGVMDSLDRCPGTPVGTAVDNSGCRLAERIRLEGVTFYHDSSQITQSSRAILDSAVRIMLRHPDLYVEVAGHTDSQGSDDYNLGLSQRRAESVRDYLVSRGANPARLSARGYGESDPVADNRTREGRRYNRRVELRH